MMEWVRTGVLAVALCAAGGGIALAEVSAPAEVRSATPTLADEFVEAAREIASHRIRYRMAYPRIPYPAGDVPAHEGLCCDVIVRALRACGIDLQELVYEDVRRNPAAYRTARRAAVGGAQDASWMHRRTAYLDVFLKRHAETLTTLTGEDHRDQWRTGDIVIFKRNGWETWHIAVVSDSTPEHVPDRPLVDAWSDPGYASESNKLSNYGPIGGHYRLPSDFRDRLSAEHIDRARASWANFIRAHEGPRVASHQRTGDLRPSGVEN